ncbi:hypothetical protein LPJ55_002102 [Coemansia sp. RSA 990]|nr:hypothetical protein LPJ55_002102 [Coemansia sp. RSA 990]
MPSSQNGGQVTRSRTKKRQKRRVSTGHKQHKQSDEQSTEQPKAPSITACEPDEHITDRCTMHPGSRNEQWCADCQLAICMHCISNHKAHKVSKLSAIYDDTYEAIEQMQHQLVAMLADTRKWKTQLDTQATELSLSYVRAQEALDTHVRNSADYVESEYERMNGSMQSRVQACGEWREVLEETMTTVQQMVEELSPALLVARRDRVLSLLDAVEKSRPAILDEEDEEGPESLVMLVRPCWEFSGIQVPRVMELGRRRGHVRVVGDLFTAHGMVWQAEARRSRGALGDPCLSVTVSCMQGCRSSAYSVSVHLAANSDSKSRKFLQETHSHTWYSGSQCEFSLCSLSELKDAQVLDDDEGVVIKIGIRPESFKDLAHVQQDRIKTLEQRVKELEEQQPSNDTSAERSLHRRTSSAAYDQNTFADVAFADVPQSDPLPKPRDALVQNLTDTPLAERQKDFRLSFALRRRANSSLALGQQPQSKQKHLTMPIPFSLNNANRVFENAHASDSQSSVNSSQSSASNVLRRLSGWMKSTEDRVVQQARRVRSQLSQLPGQKPSDDLDDWTLLEGSLSPGFFRSETEPISLNVQLARAHDSIELKPPPPQRPLPEVPKLEHGRDLEDGFAFDGMADIERQQAKIDARQLAKQQADSTQEKQLQDRYDSILERIDALQLIANTVENSRDGFTEGTLRRISSELGVLINGRRQSRVTDVRTLEFASRRTFSMNSKDTHQAVARIDFGQMPESKHARFAKDIEEDDGLPSSHESSGEYERPLSPGLSPRRNSLGIDIPAKLDSHKEQQLTPQSNRRGGGILKPGRTQRSIPLCSGLPELSAPNSNEAFGMINVRTPQGSGKFTEYTADSQSSSPASISPESKSSRSATLPLNNLSRTHGARNLESTPTAQTVAARQVRSARASRKRVRFPEEQRLLETIRLIDPRVAQSIECRAGKSLSADSAVSFSDPPRARSPPPRFNLNVLKPTDNAQSEDDVPVPDTGLASRIRSSPRLGAKPLSPNIKKMTIDEDDVFVDSISSPVSSGEEYDTANSQLLDNSDELRPRSMSGTRATKRPPIPLQLQLTRSSSVPGISNESNRLSTAIVDHSILSPTFASSPAHCRSKNFDSGRSSLGISIASEDLSAWRSVNSQGMQVGPNVGSPPSSPSSRMFGSANCSSSSSPTL